MICGLTHFSSAVGLVNNMKLESRLGVFFAFVFGVNVCFLFGFLILPLRAGHTLRNSRTVFLA